MEHLFFHWEDITDLLIDDLLEEEVHERNRLEELAATRSNEEEDEDDDTFNQYREDACTTQQKVLAEELTEQISLKNAVKSVDMRDIMRLLDDYLTTEKSIVNRL